MLALLMEYRALFFLSMVLVGMGLSVLFGAPVRYITINEAPAGERGAAQAIGNIFTGTGQTVSSALIGAIITSAGGGIPGYRLAYEFAGLLTFFIFLLSLGLRSRRRERLKLRPAPSLQELRERFLGRYASTRGECEKRAD
jgi:MFS family permease